ncbi:uncharacterized protein LOC142989046 [Genypterus blacodes]|uniref:uncharacterized protein LOC142989046 n=1 Tax=Genypterus blacodes TaxID=154954 RepID=UPI003F760080
MATGVNYWSAYEPRDQLSECVWGVEPEYSSEDGGGGVTWETQAMEVKGQIISAPDPLSGPDRKQKAERKTELQERRRSLQVLLSTRLTELRRICLQEAELTGAVPSDFPLEAGERPPCVRQRGGASRQGSRKCKAEEEEAQRSRRKTLFSGALRKHSDSEHNMQNHTHHGKRTVHRGCHTDDTVGSESSSTSDSTGHDNDDGVSQSRPLLVTVGSPVEVYYQNKTRRNSVNNRKDRAEILQNHKLLPLPTSQSPPHPLQPAPPRSQDGSCSSGPSEPGGPGELGVRSSGGNSAPRYDGLLDRAATSSEEEGGPGQQGGLPVSRGRSAGGEYRSSETLTDGQTRIMNGHGEAGGRGGRAGRGRGGYSDMLLDYVWGKQQKIQLQRQQTQTNPRQSITSLHYNSFSTHQPPAGAPPTYQGHLLDQRRVKVTRTKSCGPFLSAQAECFPDTHNPSQSTLQPDPHPHLLPPRPSQLPNASHDGQLEEATRSLHKALALEGLRDWYLRNTLGPAHQNLPNGNGNAKVSGRVKGQSIGVGGALQRRRTTHGVLQQSAYQSETHSHQAPPPLPHHHKQTPLPHSATFHGQTLLGRSFDGSLYYESFPLQKQEVPVQDVSMDQPSPGTLV